MNNSSLLLQTEQWFCPCTVPSGLHTTSSENECSPIWWAILSVKSVTLNIQVRTNFYHILMYIFILYLCLTFAALFFFSYFVSFECCAPQHQDKFCVSENLHYPCFICRQMSSDLILLTHMIRQIFLSVFYHTMKACVCALFSQDFNCSMLLPLATAC